MSCLNQTHQAVMLEWALLHHWLCNQKHPWGICSCSPIVNFLKFTFYHGMVTLVIFLIKNDLIRHIKHENLLSIYENMDYFQIMLFTVTCWKFQKIQQPYIKRYFYVFFSTNTVETLYNTINFCWSTHKRHSIARPKGRVQRATYCVDLSILSSIKYLL